MLKEKVETALSLLNPKTTCTGIWKFCNLRMPKVKFASGSEGRKVYYMYL